jgi:pimeloyl-ACP methyl ester carboxylesterase
MDDAELRQMTAADRAKADELPVLDRLMSKSFQTRMPELTWLFRKIGTFNRANQGSIRNLADRGPTPQAVIDSRVKLAFLVGENDTVISRATLEKAHALIPGSRLIMIPDGPHSMYWENPAVFNCAVEQFLSGFLPAS